MAKRRVKKPAKQSAAATTSNICCNESQDPQIGEEAAFKDQEGINITKMMMSCEGHNVFYSSKLVFFLFFYRSNH